MSSLLETAVIGGIVGGLFATLNALVFAPKKPDKSLNELMVFAKNGDFEGCENLIKTNFVNINSQDNKGATALIYAVLSTNEQIVKLLIDSGADKSIFTKKGLTALAIAKNNKMKNMVGLLS